MAMTGLNSVESSNSQCRPSRSLFPSEGASAAQRSAAALPYRNVVHWYVPGSRLEEIGDGIQLDKKRKTWGADQH